MGGALAKAFVWIAATIGQAVMVFGAGVKTAAVIGMIVTTAVFVAAGSALMGRLVRTPDIGLAQQGSIILSNSPSNTAPIPVIYGSRRVGGTRYFVGTSNGFENGQMTNKNDYLHMIIGLGEGPVSEITAVYLNNVEAWPNKDNRFVHSNPNGNPVVYIEPHLGEADQEASAELVHIANNNILAYEPEPGTIPGIGIPIPGSSPFSQPFEWTEDHRLRGVAYLYVRLHFDQEIFASGVPNITADIKGRPVKDTRQLVNGVVGTAITRYSNNPALCIRDYLTNTIYGRAISEDLIDDTSFEAAANYCDEEVTFEYVEDGFGKSATQKRYTLNGVVDTSESSLNIVNKMLTACRGSLVFSGGKYKLVLDKAETAALTFDESNVMGDYEITLAGKDTLANRVEASFFNPENEWQADLAYEENTPGREVYDNGLLLEKKIELPFTANRIMAQYIARQNLSASRNNIILSFKTTQEGLLAEIGDVIYVKLEAPGWDTLNSNAGKKFRVIQMEIEATDEIKITAIEYSDVVYQLYPPAYRSSLGTALPHLNVVLPPTDVTASETLFFSSPKVINRVSMSWTPPEVAYARSYDVAYKKLNDTEFTAIATTTAKQYTFDNLKPGTYTFNVRAKNNAGFTSAYSQTTLVVKGVTSLPAVNPPAITGVVESLVSSTLGSGVKAKARLTWSAIANSEWEDIGVNIESYEIQYKLTSEATNYESPGSSTGTYFDFFDITPGNYNIRVRAINDAGVKSNYAETTTEIVALTDPPANVSNFYMRADGVEAHLSWEETTDLDVKVGGTFEIRHSVATSGATWIASTPIGDAVPGSSNGVTMPLLVGTYLIKAVDSTSHKSDSATTIVNTISPSVLQKRTYQTVTDTAFAGTKTNMVVSDGKLELEADTLIDDMTTLMDVWGEFDSIGGVDLEGTYEFSDKIDLTLAGGATLSGGVTFTTESLNDYLDMRTTNFDSWADFDYNTIFDDVVTTLYVSSTTDDPASGGATWSDWSEFTIGNYYGRGFKFKLKVNVGDSSHQINVSQLQAQAEVYYRFESEGVTTDASGSALTFDSSFRAAPQINITAQDLATGDYYTITSPSATGFTLKFFNSSGTGVSRSAYYIARGY
mgnify:CR=1 FL=1|tara:strand:- start:9356 stop:12688 length:3333 start_codon:yes stop_codon:yes gene_type:complete